MSVIVQDGTNPSSEDSAGTGKNIVLCCDGTSNDVTCDSTNVLRLFRSLTRDGQQIGWYDPGVGTVADPRELTRTGKLISRKLDMAIGASVRENVCQGYRFLVRAYEPGDRIFLFGFSRGAYTVRALAGMIQSLGLVRRELEDLDKLAWAIYADDGLGLPASKQFASGGRFKKSFSIDGDVRIHFIGVWDTVSSFGWIWDPLTLPFTANNPGLDHVRHAVSIDEHRAAFQANLFWPQCISQHKSFKQVWFPGSHGDVGGGYPDADNGLAKIALEWMYEEAEACGCRFELPQIDNFLGKSSKLSKPDPLATAHNSTTGLWNLLEFVPRKQWDAAAKRMSWFRPNFYRRRVIPKNAALHSSVAVKLRDDPRYRPPNLPK